MNEILVVDDHPVVLASLKTVLAGSFPDTHIRCLPSLGALETFLDAADEMREKHRVLMAFVDLNLPDADGIDVIRWILARLSVPVVAVSGYAEPAQIRKCAEYGAVGFIEKSSNLGIYPAVANLVLSGGTFFPSEFAVREEPQKYAAEPAFALTPRQKEVLDLLVDGKPNKIIASILGLSEGTVKNHVGALFERFKVKSRTQLISTIMKSNFLLNERR
jgi:DNA-binding NarL/FixJ family response regulator